MDIIKMVRDWVKEKYTSDNHLLRAEYWIKKIDSYADTACIVAAMSHDIERAFYEGRNPPNRGAKWDDETYNLWHGKRSAQIVKKFLLTRGIKNQELIQKVEELITYHEIGGNEEKNLVKDSDSVSFLENNIAFFLSRIPEIATKEEIREKFDYMFNRISSKKAKELGKPFYKKALEKLENLQS